MLIFSSDVYVHIISDCKPTIKTSSRRFWDSFIKVMTVPRRSLANVKLVIPNRQKIKFVFCISGDSDVLSSTDFVILYYKASSCCYPPRWLSW